MTDTALVTDGINATTLRILQEQDMMNAALLRLSTTADLQRIGITLGMALLLKQLYPCPEVAGTTTAPLHGTGQVVPAAASQPGVNALPETPPPVSAPAPERRLGVLLHGRAPFRGELTIANVRKFLDQYSLEELKLAVSQMQEWWPDIKLDWDNLYAGSKSSVLRNLLDKMSRALMIAELMVPFGRSGRPTPSLANRMYQAFPPPVLQALHEAVGEDFLALSQRVGGNLYRQIELLVTRLEERGELELIGYFARTRRQDFPSLHSCYIDVA